MSNSTYSFQDANTTLSHPAMGQYTANGEGVGTVTWSMATDRSTQDVAADGSVMTSKIKGRNGTIAISIQQTSALNQWLTRLYNYLETAPASEWTGITVVQRAASMGQLKTATGVCFQKLPDVPYQAQGQQITWTLMAADVQQDVI